MEKRNRPRRLQHIPFSAHLTPETQARIEDAYDHALAPGTRELYDNHQLYFKNWCDANSFCDRPAELGTILAYITDRAENLAVATIRTAIAAIRSYHEDANLQSPTTHPEVRKTLKGLARQHRRTRRQATALDTDAFTSICAAAFVPKDHESQHEADRRGTFDIALISVMRDAMLRRSEAAAAKWRDIHILDDGTFILEIPKSKTDQYADGAAQFLSPFTIQALANMLQMRGDAHPHPDDAIFLISGRQLSNRIDAAAAHAGLTGRYRGHSPRIGMAVDLAINGAELASLTQAGRWSSPKSVLRYIDKIKASKNAVAQFYGNDNSAN